MATWIERGLSGGANDPSQVCINGTKIFYCDDPLTYAGASFQNNPNGDVYQFETATATESVIYDASTFTTTPEIHRLTYGIAVFSGTLYGMFRYYESGGPSTSTVVKSWNGSTWSTVYTLPNGGSYGRLVTNGSRLYAGVWGSTPSVSPADTAYLYYSDDGSSWNAGTVNDAPLVSGSTAGDDWQLNAYYPSGIFLNLHSDNGDDTWDRKVFKITGTTLEIHSDNTANTLNYRGTGDDGVHWAENGNPPKYFTSAAFTATTTPTNNSAVDDNPISINLPNSYAFNRLPSNAGTEVYRLSGTSWVLWDTISIPNPIGPQIVGQDAGFIMKANGKFWIFGLDLDGSVWKFFETDAPSFSFDVSHSQDGIPGSII